MEVVSMAFVGGSPNFSIANQPVGQANTMQLPSFAGQDNLGMDLFSGANQVLGPPMDLGSLGQGLGAALEMPTPDLSSYSQELGAGLQMPDMSAMGNFGQGLFDSPVLPYSGNRQMGDLLNSMPAMNSTGLVGNQDLFTGVNMPQLGMDNLALGESRGEMWGRLFTESQVPENPLAAGTEAIASPFAGALEGLTQNPADVQAPLEGTAQIASPFEGIMQGITANTVIPESAVTNTEANGETPVAENPVEGNPFGVAIPAAELPTTTIPAEGLPVAELPVSDNTTEDAPVEEGLPVAELPIADNPIDGNPLEGLDPNVEENAPIAENPLEGIPVEGAPVAENPLEGIAGVPTEEITAEDNPLEENPVAAGPVAATPLTGTNPAGVGVSIDEFIDDKDEEVPPTTETEDNAEGEENADGKGENIPGFNGIKNPVNGEPLTGKDKGKDAVPQDNGIKNPFENTPATNPVSTQPPAESTNTQNPENPQKGPSGNEAPTGDPTKQGMTDKADAGPAGAPAADAAAANQAVADMQAPQGTTAMTPEIQAMTASNGLNQYDEIVKSKFGDEAFVIDSSESVQGELDANDVIKFVDKETGETKVRTVGAEDAADFKLRGNTVNAAHQFNDAMRSGRVSFEGDLSQQKYNEQYWEPQMIDGKQFWHVKPGVKPSDAINDMFNGGEYSMDCAASANIVLLKAKMDTIGADKFDQQYNGLAINGWDTGTDPSGMGMLQFDGDGPLDGFSGDPHTLGGSSANLRPGDMAYFRNPDVRQGESANQGENAIYLGNDGNGEPIFFGNPIGMATGESNQYGSLSTYKSSMDANKIAGLMG
jgi:hypothetical protein